MERLFFLTLFVSSSLFSSEILNYINRLRVASGASKLKYNSSLTYASKKHAIYLSKNYEFGHFENPNRRYFYGRAPWNRITKAGFLTKAVVENISFGERDYRASVDKIMATVYHRLAFLDIKIDSIGYAKYRSVYVYDMSNSRVGSLCKRSWRKFQGDTVENICKDSVFLPRDRFYSAINQTKRASKAFIIYPYPNQRGLPTKMSEERPKFSTRAYGLPVTLCFNDYYIRGLRLKKFEIYHNGEPIRSRVVTFRNDRNGKIPKNCFILLPYKKLRNYTRYEVRFNANSRGKNLKKRWYFYTD